QRGGERTQGERHVGDHGTDQDAGERKRQPLSRQAEQPLAQRTARAQQDQQVITEHGRRQDQRQGHERFAQESPAPAGGGHPPRPRQTENQQDQRGREGQAKRQPQSLPVHAHSKYVRLAEPDLFFHLLLGEHETVATQNGSSLFAAEKVTELPR